VSTEARVTTLEQAMLRTQDSLVRLSDEMRTFKDEMRQFREDVRAAGDRAEERSREADRRLEETRREMRESSKASDRRWGKLANKMGTLAEDIVAPGIPAILRTVFGSEVQPELTVRAKRRHQNDPGRMREFDVTANSGDLFLLSETRSRLTPEDVRELVAFLPEARAFLPEAVGKRLVGAVASFYVDPSLVAAGERHGLLVLGLSTGLMEILNSPGFRPREF